MISNNLAIELAKQDLKKAPENKSISMFCDLISHYEFTLEECKTQTIQELYEGANLEDPLTCKALLENIKDVLEYNREQPIFDYEGYLFEDLKLSIIDFMNKKENTHLLEKPLITIYEAVCYDCDLVNDIIANSNDDTNLYGNSALLKKALETSYNDSAIDFILNQNDFFYHIVICEYLIYNKLLFKAIADVVF